MTETQPKRINKRKAGLGLAGVIAFGVVMAGAGRMSAPIDTRADSSSPTPSSELATPRPSEAGATPEPSNAPEVVKIETFHLNPGDKFEAKVGDVVVGDVAMSDTEDATKAVFLYDTDTNKAEGKDNTHTGLLVDVQKDGFVIPPYGGDVIRGLSGDKKATWIELKKAEMENGGCEGGCTDGVDVVTWTGSETTVTQSGVKSEVNVVTPTPSESPVAGTDMTGMTNEEKKQALLLLLSGDASNLSAEDKSRLLDALIACICAGPVATPEPTPTPEAPCDDSMNDHLMKPGDKFTVKGKDFIVQGDVFIDGERYFDGGKKGEKTGAIDMVTDGKNHTIKATWGADVQVFEACTPDAKVKEVYEKDLSELRATGRSLDKKSLILKAKSN